MSDLLGKRLLLLGEFGAFGRHLAVRLARLPDVTLMLAGPGSRSTDAFARDQARARKLASEWLAQHPRPARPAPGP